MRKILDWQKYATTQKEVTGCIPTGFEFLLKMAKIKEIDYEKFQHTFNLNIISPEGNFFSVAEAIKKAYPEINFIILAYNKSEGDKKLAKIIELINQNQPVLLSLNISELINTEGWHIMPVIGVWNDNLLLINHHYPSGISSLMNVPFYKLVEIHSKLPGGNDIAYLE